MTHTPGPWNIAIRNRHEGECAPGLWITGANNTVVDTGNLKAWPLSDANARLIAAAPDMLAALRWLVEAVEDNDAGSLESAVARAKAAIARATGREG